MSADTMVERLDLPEAFEAWWQPCRHKNREPVTDYNQKKVLAWEAFQAGVRANDARIERLEAEKRMLVEALTNAEEVMSAAKVMIGAKNDALTEAQRQCNINEAWHRLKNGCGDIRSALERTTAEASARP